MASCGARWHGRACEAIITPHPLCSMEWEMCGMGELVKQLSLHITMQHGMGYVAWESL